MKSLLYTVAVLAVAAGMAVAQPAAEPMAMPMSGAMHEGMMAGMPKAPELSAEQQTQMDAQRISYLREVGPIKTDIAVKEIELAALWRADELDARKITAKVTEISSLKARLEQAEAGNRIAMHNLLTPEQRKTMRPGTGCGMMRGGMMGGGMKGGGMGGGMMGGCPMMGGMSQ